MNGKQLKNSILQWAIQGKLVPQDPNDEPASVLLERIRKEKERLVKEKKIKKDKNASIIFRDEDNSYYEKFLATGEVKCIDEEIPFEIPHGWEWCRLKNIGVTETGTTPTKSHPEYFGNTIPFYGPGNIQDNKISSVTQGISEQGLAFSRIVPPHTILQVCIGGSIGKAAIVDSECSFNQQINSITVHTSINTLYTFYVLISEFFKQQIMDKSTGTATPIINRSNWENLLIPIPPNAEQQQIIAKLTELLPVVEKYDKSQHELDVLNMSLTEQLQKSILQEAIQGKLVTQIAEEGTVQELFEQIRQEKQKLVKEGKIKKSALNDSIIFRGDDNKYYEQINDQMAQIECDYDFPSSWSIVRLSSICTLIDGEKKDGQQICLDAKYLRGKSAGDYLQRGRFVQRGDNIILVDGENSGEVFTVPCDGYMGSTFKQLWVSSVMHLPYVLNYILFYKELLRKSKRGAAIPHLNKEIFYSLIIGIPPYQEQIRIANKINEIYSKIKA